MVHGRTCVLLVAVVLLAFALPASAVAQNVDTEGALATEVVPVEQIGVTRWTMHGPAVARARQIAESYWGSSTPCGGAVTMVWIDGPADLNGRATWDNGPNGPTPVPWFNCMIRLNRVAVRTWPKLCTLIVHELGHLHGRRHSDSGNPADVMSAIYMMPLGECEEARDPERPPTTVRAASVTDLEVNIVERRARRGCRTKRCRARVRSRAAAKRKQASARRRASARGRG